MFEELAQMSITASSVTLYSANGNDLALFIILVQNNDSAEHKVFSTISSQLNEY